MAQRFILVGSDLGAELGTSSNPVQVNDLGTTTKAVTLTSAIPAGANTIGAVIVSGTTSAALPMNLATNTASLGMTVGIAPASSTVSAVQSGSWSVAISGTASVFGNVSLTSGSATIGAVIVSGTTTSRLPITGDIVLSGTASVAGTVGISGTVSVIGNISLTSGSATIGAVVISGTTSSRLPVTPDTATVIIVGTSTSAPPLNLFTITASSPLAASLTAKDIVLTSGSARIGAVYEISGQIVDENGVLKTVQRNFTNASSIGDNQVVPAQGANVRIRVLSAVVVAGGALAVTFRSGSTAITAGFPLGANGGFIMPNNPHGWFQTDTNSALNLNLELGLTTGVDVVWIQA